VSGANSAFCDKHGFSPLDSIHANVAWTALGSCVGSIAPTSAPAYNLLTRTGACPGAFSSSTKYNAGDEVSKEGLVYTCKPYPYGGWCSVSGYEPGEGAAGRWMDAWDLKGYCSYVPTYSPTLGDIDVLQECPSDWYAGKYEEGDKVQVKGIAYKCNAWPMSDHCGQPGYEPNSEATDVWKVAWTRYGVCHRPGEFAPTTSPTIDALTSIGACPDEWSSESNVKYGDMVAVTVSSSPLVRMAFKCKPWPMGDHCGQYSPSTEVPGSLGWTFVGSCSDSATNGVTPAPTGSPSFDKLTVDAGGCPEEYNSGGTGYEAGDAVSFTVSVEPARKIVYKCKEYPDTGYCNLAAFAPGTQFTSMAWTLVGACSGTIAPTNAPTTYSGNCTYSKKTPSKEIAACTEGSTGCTCTFNNGVVSKCEKEVDVEIQVEFMVDNWSGSVDYVEGDVVRIGVNQFECKPWPYYLWCRMEAYKPTLNNGIWADAWIALSRTCA